MGMSQGRSACSKRTTPVRTISLAAGTVALLAMAGLPPAVRTAALSLGRMLR